MKNRNNIETDELLHVIRETIRDAIKECTTQTQSKDFYTLKSATIIQCTIKCRFEESLAATFSKKPEHNINM